MQLVLVLRRRPPRDRSARQQAQQLAVAVVGQQVQRAVRRLGHVAQALAATGLTAFAQVAFDGPTTGPKAAEGKTIVVLAADLKNGGILGVTTGVEEAAAKIGWTVRVLDGAGSVQGRTAAFGQAMALQPSGIVINGFDAVEQQAAIEGVHCTRGCSMPSFSVMPVSGVPL